MANLPAAQSAAAEKQSRWALRYDLGVCLENAGNSEELCNVGGFTIFRDPIDSEIIGSPYDKDRKKVPLIS